MNPALGQIESVAAEAAPPRAPWWRYRRLPWMALAAWLLSGVFFVPTDQQAVVTRFGAVANPRVLPGLHYAWPWPVDRVAKLKVNQLQRLVIGGEAADLILGANRPLDSQFAGAAVEAELGGRIARSEVDAVLTTEKIAIQDAVLAGAQKRLDDYRTGVRLSTVNIEIVVAPPEAADAFRDVASARADTARIVSEAQSYTNDLLPRARGEARQMIESAQAYRASRVNQAAGDAARFSAIAAEYAKAPEVTSSRLYIEALEQILPKLRKLIIDPKGNLDLSIIRRGEPRNP